MNQVDFIVADRCLMMGYRFLPLDYHSFRHFSAQLLNCLSWFQMLALAYSASASSRLNCYSRFCCFSYICLFRSSAFLRFTFFRNFSSLDSFSLSVVSFSFHVSLNFWFSSCSCSFSLLWGQTWFLRASSYCCLRILFSSTFLRSISACFFSSSSIWLLSFSTQLFLIWLILKVCWA